MSESHPPISLRPPKKKADGDASREGTGSTKRLAKSKRASGSSEPATPSETSQPDEPERSSTPSETSEPDEPERSSTTEPERSSTPDRPSERPSEPFELAPSRRRAPQPSEDTAPFLLERSSPDVTAAAVAATHHAGLLRMARRLGVIVIVNAMLYASIAVGGALRYAGDRSAIPEVVAAIIALGLTIWGSLSGYHLLRASGGKPNAGHQLAGAFSNLRSIFILKGTGLFLVLALSCFAFSAVLSLFALL